MKQLFIIRHSKAEPSQSMDKQRKLTEKGHHDAEMMARRLLEQGYKIEKIFSSTATRALQTAGHFAEVHGVQPQDLKAFDSLYLADTLEITLTIEWLKQNVNNLAIVAHNPGISNFTNDITHTLQDHLPTSGIAIIEVSMDNWEEDFEAADKQLVAILTPKDGL